LLLRPDVIAAEYRLKAAHANLGAARAAFLPKILLTAGAGVASQALAGLFSAGSWTFQPAISMPLFDGGRTESGRDLAAARKEIAIAEYERTIQLAFREVSDLLAASSSTRRQLRGARANEQAQKFRLEMAAARAQAGLSSTIDVLDAQRELLAARQTTLQVRRTQLDAAAQLYRALGGGQPETQLAQDTATPSTH
jgi:multidrug efflux system outer membrane protein